MSAFFYTLFFVNLAIVLIISYLIFAWNRAHAPFLITSSYCGSVASAVETNSKCSIVDEAMRPDGIYIDKMPAINESRTRFTLMMYLKPENFSERYLTRPVAEKTDVNENNDNIRFGSPQGMNNAILLVQGDNNIMLEYDPYHNDFVIKIRIRFDLKGFQKKDHQEFRIRNMLKLQKWNNICLVVDGRIVDVYLDGDLYRSWTLLNVPIISGTTWSLLPGKVEFHGIISCIRFVDFNLKQKDVSTLMNSFAMKTEPVRGWFWWLWAPVMAPDLAT